MTTKMKIEEFSSSSSNRHDKMDDDSCDRQGEQQKRQQEEAPVTMPAVERLEKISSSNSCSSNESAASNANAFSSPMSSNAISEAKNTATLAKVKCRRSMTKRTRSKTIAGIPTSRTAVDSEGRSLSEVSRRDRVFGTESKSAFVFLTQLSSFTIIILYLMICDVESN